MADKVSIAIRQEQALNRLNAVAGRIAAKVGVQAPTVRTRHPDRELLRAEQFETIAAWAEAVEAWIPLAASESEDTAEVEVAVHAPQKRKKG
jgi:hypothetical protein